MLHNRMWFENGKLNQVVYNLTFKDKREPKTKEEEEELIKRFNEYWEKKRNQSLNPEDSTIKIHNLRL